MAVKPHVGLLLATFAAPILTQAQSNPPPWPDLSFTSCPKIVPTPPRSSLHQLMWLHGQSEEADFNAAVMKLQAKDYRAAADGFRKFAEQYSDSEYSRDAALVFELQSLSYLRDENEVVRVAAQIIRLPEAPARIRELGFVGLVSALTPRVRPDDAQMESKLADLEKWTGCGRDALAARVSDPAMVRDEAFENTRRMAEAYLDRADGFVALMRKQYVVAQTRLEAAYKLDSQDALTCLLLFESKTLNLYPDTDAAVFYLARWAVLAPEVETSTGFLKRIYVIIHGSEKGLPEVKQLAKTNITPPSGFTVQRQVKERHHYGAGIAATALLALFAYEMVQHPDVARGIASSFTPSTPTKLMIFGGSGHAVYLGCLDCSEVAADSVYNEVGPHGSRVSPVSIWNSVGQYGSRVSPYSACNPLATDPPVIVDEDGAAYGRLTLNRVNPNIGMGARFYNWLATAVCER